MKNKKNTFMKNVVVLMISQLIIKIVGLIYKLYLTNKEGFGDEGNAIYSSGFQIYALLLTLSSIGVPNAIAKLVSAKVAVGDNKGAYRIFKIAFVLFGLVGFIGSLILFVGAHNISNYYLQIPEAEMSLMALAPSIFLVSISSVLRGYFNGRENISTTANSQSIEQTLKTILTILIVEIVAAFSSKNTILMTAGATMATSLATLSSFFYLYMFYKIKKKQMWQEITSSVKYKNERIKTIVKSILLVSTPITLSALLSTANKTIDALTVVRELKNFMEEKYAVIQYGILSGKIDTLITLPYSFNIAFSTALVPAISYAITIGRKNIAEKRIKFSILTTILIGLPCSLCLMIFAEPILNMLFPNASSGANMLKINSITIIFAVLIQTINGALQGLGEVKTPVIALTLGTLLKLVLNLILIPISTIGIYGAILSSILCDIIAFSIIFLKLKKCTDISFSISRFIIKPLLATIGMTIIAYWIYIKVEILILALILGGISYVLLILILKILSKEEIFMIPYGQKLYKTLIKLKIYKEDKSQ